MALNLFLLLRGTCGRGRTIAHPKIFKLVKYAHGPRLFPHSVAPHRVRFHCAGIENI